MAAASAGSVRTRLASASRPASATSRPAAASAAAAVAPASSTSSQPPPSGSSGTARPRRRTTSTMRASMPSRATGRARQDRANGVGRRGHVRVAEHDQHGRGRDPYQPDGGLKDHGQGALAADQGPGQVAAPLRQQVLQLVAGVLAGEAAELGPDGGQGGPDHLLQPRDGGGAARAGPEALAGASRPPPAPGRCRRCGRRPGPATRRRCCRSSRRGCSGCGSTGRARSAARGAGPPPGGRRAPRPARPWPWPPPGPAPAPAPRCRLRSMTTPGPTALPAIEVPAPLAVSGTPSSRQMATTASTSSGSRGKATSSGGTRYSEASVEYSARRRADVVDLGHPGPPQGRGQLRGQVPDPSPSETPPAGWVPFQASS